MKKAICLIVILLSIISLSSCECEYVEAEDIRIKNHSNYIAFLNAIPYNAAIDAYYKYYPTNETVIYFPQSGDFTTKAGEKFTSKVSDKVLIRFVEDSYHSRIAFTIEIYDETGKLIMTKERFCSYVQENTQSPDITYVSEDFREYWLAMSVRSDELKK